MPIIPVPDAETIIDASNVALPRSLWAELDAVAQYEIEKESERAAAENRKPVSYSRTKIMRHFLEWALTEYWKDEEAARRPSLVAAALKAIEDQKKKSSK